MLTKKKINKPVIAWILVLVFFGFFVCVRGWGYSWLSDTSLAFLQIILKQNVKPRNSKNNRKQALSVLIDLTQFNTERSLLF